MEPPFAAYVGDQPYLFVSYAHSDANLIYPELSSFHEAHVNVWYDDGIEVGAEWREEIADAITHARLFLYFVTSSSIQSENCKREVNFAIDQAIPVVLIYLEPIELTGGLKLTLADRQAINKYEISRAAYDDKITKALNKHLESSVENLSTPGRVRLTSLRNTILGFLAFVVVSGILFSIPPSRAWIFDQSLAFAVNINSLFSQEMEVQPGIAVLPFANLSGDPGDDYFSDGITEEILNDLVKMKRLPVIARASSFQFKGSNLDAEAIGRRLGVTRIVEGSVRKHGNNVRIMARLVDAESGDNLWSHSVDGELANVFELQREISMEIVAEIDRALGQAERLQRMPKGTSTERHTPNIEAYDFYLKGLQAQASKNPFEVETAIPLFERAIALDAEYADAWTELGWTYVALASPNQGKRIGADVSPIAINAFRQALSIDPNHAKAMGGLGYQLIFYEYNWSKGIQLLEAAVDLAPDNALVIAGYGLVLLITGHESATVIERGHRLDPLQPTNILFRAIQLAMDGQQVQALSLMDTALIAHSKGYTANYQIARFNAQAGRLSKAEKHLALAKMIVGPEYPALKVVEYMIARRRGDEQTAEQLKGEIYSLMRSERVPFLLEVDWNREELAVVLETALQQKSAELLGIFLQGRHPLTSEAQWKEYQSRINFSEADIGTLRPPFFRNQEEEARLLTEASHLSDEQLSQYVGSYKREIDGGIRTIVLENGRLQYTSRAVAGDVGGFPNGAFYYLVPAGEHEFKVLSRRYTINFGVSNQTVNTMNVFLELEERTIVAVKVDQE